MGGKLESIRVGYCTISHIFPGQYARKVLESAYHLSLISIVPEGRSAQSFEPASDHAFLIK